MNLKTVIYCSVIFSFFSSSANSGFFEDEKTSILKCGKAAFYLQDSSLESASDYYLKTNMKDINTSPREVMELGQELREEAEPDGRQTSHTLEAAQEWKDSDFCVKVIEIYAEYMNSKFDKYSKFVIENPDSKDACIQFIELRDIGFPFNDEKNKKIANSIKANILNNMQSFRPSQREAMSEVLSRSLDPVFDIESGCKNGLSLTESIRMTDTIQYAKSPTTKALESLSAELEKSRYDTPKCGNGSKLFCDASLMSSAVNQALADSIKCDASIGNCFTDIKDFIDPVFNDLIKQNLLAIKNAHLNADRVDGFDYGMEEYCNGVRNEKGVVDDIIEYDKLVCEPLIAYNLNLARQRNIIPVNLELIGSDPSKKLSETSQTIRDFILQHEKDKECGELPNIYCESRLTNAEATLAFNESLECDLANEQSNNCPLDMKGLGLGEYINSRTLTIKKSRLNADKIIYEKYLNQDVEKNSLISQTIHAKANNCKYAEREKGVIGDSLEEYMKSTCEPQAKIEYLRPAQEVLDKINKNLTELSNNTPAPAAPSTSVNPGAIEPVNGLTAPASGIDQSVIGATKKPISKVAVDSTNTQPVIADVSKQQVGVTKSAEEAETNSPVISQQEPVTSQSAQVKPSFDCNKATSVNEKLICSDSELSRLDNELSATYQQAKASAKDPAEFKQKAVIAWKNREATCSEKPCLVNWYAEIKAALLEKN